MKGPAAPNDQLNGPAVTFSTDQLDVSSAPANSTTPGQHNDPITPSSSYRWRKRDLITDHIPFTGSFSDPPHEIPTPLQYFRWFLLKNVRNILLANQICMLCKNKGTWHIIQ